MFFVTFHPNTLHEQKMVSIFEKTLSSLMGAVVGWFKGAIFVGIFLWFATLRFEEWLQFLSPVLSASLL